jgi:hypothetical protein
VGFILVARHDGLSVVLVPSVSVKDHSLLALGSRTFVVLIHTRGKSYFGYSMTRAANRTLGVEVAGLACTLVAMAKLEE